MKTLEPILAACAVAMTLTMAPFALSASAQGPDAYWNVETNSKTKKYTVIRFYTHSNTLFYEERLEGVHLKIRRKKVQRQLNQALAKAWRLEYGTVEHNQSRPHSSWKKRTPCTMEEQS
jgi:hypothetical protein